MLFYITTLTSLVGLLNSS